MEFHRGRLIDHVHLVVRDLEASRRFYRAVLDVIGVPIVDVALDERTGFGVRRKHLLDPRERRHGFGPQVRLIEVEEHVGGVGDPPADEQCAAAHPFPRACCPAMVLDRASAEPRRRPAERLRCPTFMIKSSWQWRRRTDHRRIVALGMTLLPTRPESSRLCPGCPVTGSGLSFSARRSATQRGTALRR
jgi:hypothetical protein